MRNYAHKILYVFGLSLLTVILMYAPIENEAEVTAINKAAERKEEKQSLVPSMIQAYPVAKEEKSSTYIQVPEPTKIPDNGKPITPPSVNGYADRTISVYAVSSSQLNVRNQPGTHGKILQTLKQGKTVIIEEKLPNGWFKLKDGGYINAKYLAPAKETGSTKQLISRSKPRVKAASLSVPTRVSTKITEPSNLTPEQLNQILDGTELEGLGHAFSRMEDETNVNALFGIAVAKLESGHGTSALARNKNNLFGLNAIDGDAYNKAFRFDSKEECILYFGELIREKYINQGRTTLQSINRKYAPTNSKWSGKVHQIMKADYSKLDI